MKIIFNSLLKHLPLFLFLLVLLCLRITQIQTQRNEIACTVIQNSNNDNSNNDNIFNYDCSHKNLDWSNLEQLIDHIRGASNLNLAFNKFSDSNSSLLLPHTIYNQSFDLFQQLTHTLNLSSNQFEHVQPQGFYYSLNSNMLPHRFTHLDLSNNSFELLPWSSLRHLPKLSTLYFSFNPLKKLDFGDLMISETFYGFESLTKLVFSSCQLEYVDAGLFKIQILGVDRFVLE